MDGSHIVGVLLKSLCMRKFLFRSIFLLRDYHHLILARSFPVEAIFLKRAVSRPMALDRFSKVLS